MKESEKPLITVADAAEVFFTEALLSKKFIRGIYSRLVQCAAEALNTDTGRTVIIDRLLRLPPGTNHLPENQKLDVVIQTFNAFATNEQTKLPINYQNGIWDLAETCRTIAPQMLTEALEPQYFPLFVASLKNPDRISYPILRAGFSKAASSAYKMVIGDQGISIDQSLITVPSLS